MGFLYAIQNMFQLENTLSGRRISPKFHCQLDHKRRLSDISTSRTVFHKKQKIDIVEYCEQVREYLILLETFVYNNDNVKFEMESRGSYTDNN